MMELEFHTVNVFAGEAFAGNRVAVVPDADGLSAGQMQAIAAEFGYSETAFVRPAQDSSRVAELRVFTPRGEVPFAGQPAIATAFVLGRLGRAHGRRAAPRILLEAQAGPVTAELMLDGARIAGASVRPPGPLLLRPELAPETIATCAGLTPADIRTDRHPPLIASLGVPFAIAELTSAAALARAWPDLEAFAAHLPIVLTKGLHLYVRDGEAGDGSARRLMLRARTFTPLHGTIEDTATGSANAALAALLATLAPSRRRGALTLVVMQGKATGRPAVVEASSIWSEPAEMQTWVQGHCAPVMRSHVRVPES